jgi:two-component system, chemotaxis family, protein-glutamate methylesterase/glutaminase
MNNPIRVLVVDDSALMRKVVSDMLNSRPDIEVVGQARDGQDALNKLDSLRPDVLTLDVEMPVMDGITALKEIMSSRPMPVVMLSSLTHEGAETTLKCLEIGAIDFIAKPSGAISLDISKVSDQLYLKVKTAYGARFALRNSTPSQLSVVLSQKATATEPSKKKGLVFFGASTGGPKALHAILPRLSADLGVPIVVVQHLPEAFTKMLANRLNDECSYEVREAVEGDTLQPGVALIAPGGKHLKFSSDGLARLTDGPALHGVKPAIDITLASLIPTYGRHLVASILTGMGRDGADALKMLRECGGTTFAEDESTCVVFGMPRAAQEIGAVTKMLPIGSFADEIQRAIRGESQRSSQAV